MQNLINPLRADNVDKDAYDSELLHLIFTNYGSPKSNILQIIIVSMLPDRIGIDEFCRSDASSELLNLFFTVQNQSVNKIRKDHDKISCNFSDLLFIY